jgi:hypothetical protein
MAQVICRDVIAQEASGSCLYTVQGVPIDCDGVARDFKPAADQ